MKWEKVGKIFDPSQANFVDGYGKFAQSPQVLLFDDFIRVYFSTRKMDNVGKYLSGIGFVDFSKAYEVLRISDKSVLDLGKLGCYDEHGVFPLNILRTGNKLLGYIGGWNRRVSVSVDGSIGVALSTDDGVTFQRIGDGPVLTSSIHEPFLIGDPFVRRYGDKFHMWYIFGTNWTSFSDDAPPDRTYKIGHAESSDGIEWKKLEDGRQIVDDRLGPEESQAMPTVVKIGETYHMYFCYRESSDFRKSKNRGYRIGYAYSTDLMNWVRDDSAVGIDVTEGSWDSDMLCYPHVFEMDGDVFLMYNGNEFGRHGFGVARLQR